MGNTLHTSLPSTCPSKPLRLFHWEKEEFGIPQPQRSQAATRLSPPSLSHHTHFLQCLLAAQLIDKKEWEKKKKGPKQQLGTGTVGPMLPHQPRPWGGHCRALHCREEKLLCMHRPPLICAGFIMVILGAQSGGDNLLILCHFLKGVKIMEH